MKKERITRIKCIMRERTTSGITKGVSSFIRRAYHHLRGSKNLVATLSPPTDPVGYVLISYVHANFSPSGSGQIPHSHTHFWECSAMARSFVEQGYSVDIIRWTNLKFIPSRDYSFFVDVRKNLERIAPLLRKDCMKIMHAETAHPSVHNTAQLARLRALHERRGLALQPFKLIEENRAIETAECATVLGNEFTMDSYRFAGKPMHRIPISCPMTYPAPQSKDFATAGRRFVWFGSEGFVHKGLDLVLEAFAGMPEFHLTVCGPIRRERPFQIAYYRELYETENIHTAGWVSVASEEFLQLCESSVGLIYPTCSEGGGGSVINCMHAGLIPIVPDSASVDLAPEFGVRLEDISVEGIREAIRTTAARPAGELHSMSRAAHRFVNERHTRETFLAAYRALVNQWVDQRA
jgi:glycosyltransferase involved in cell wall biosynthesis